MQNDSLLLQLLPAALRFERVLGNKDQEKVARLAFMTTSYKVLTSITKHLKCVNFYIYTNGNRIVTIAHRRFSNLSNHITEVVL